MRYNQTNIKTDSQGTRYQDSLIIPRIPLSGNDQYVQVSANGIGKGTMSIQEGAILRLPANPSAVSAGLTGY